MFLRVDVFLILSQARKTRFLGMRTRSGAKRGVKIGVKMPDDDSECAILASFFDLPGVLINLCHYLRFSRAIAIFSMVDK